MSWWNWQGRLLPYAVRYGLLKSGFLDEDTAKDLANFDVSLGSKRSAIELKNVGLNVERIRQLAQLPPAIRLEAARVSALRLYFVRDGYQPNIELELDGIEIFLRVDDELLSDIKTADQRSRSTSPTMTQTPQHRKVNRRTRSPPPYDPGGIANAVEGLHLPTTQEMARSFLLSETPRERKEMEASMAAEAKGLEESILSEASEDGDVGTGVTGGLPAVLSSMLEGVLDRAKYKVTGFHIRVETQVETPAADHSPVALESSIGQVEGCGLRNVRLNLQDISLALHTNDSTLEGFAELSRHPSPTLSREPTSKSGSSEQSWASAAVSTVLSKFSPSPLRSASLENAQYAASVNEVARPTIPASNIRHAPPLHETMEERFTAEQDQQPDSEAEDDANDIQAGDDNITWTSRRSHSNPSEHDLWSSMLSDDAAGNSLFFGDVPESVRLSPSSRTRSVGAETRLSEPSVSVEPRFNAYPLRSWPALDAQDIHARSRSSPGSWPGLDQDIHSVGELPRSPAPHSLESGADADKALSDSDVDSRLDQTESPEAEPSDDMLQSRMYTHEEAESIYMSAMMGDPIAEGPKSIAAQGRNLEVNAPAPNADHIPSDGAHHEPLVPSDADDEAEALNSANFTPRAQSPELRSHLPTVPEPLNQRSVYQLLLIDKISVVFTPAKAPSGEEQPGPKVSEVQSTIRPSRQQMDMPGAFSVYSDMSRSRNMSASVHVTSSESSSSAPLVSTDAATESAIEVEVGTMSIQIDFATGQMLHHTSSRIWSSAPSQPAGAVSKSDPAGRDDSNSRTTSLSTKIRSFRASLVEHLSASPSSMPVINSDQALISLVVENAGLEYANDYSLTVGALSVHLGRQELLVFKHDYGSMTNSRIFREDDPVVSLTGAHQRTASNQTITTLSLETASLHVLVDLTNIDDTFGSYGGLSGLLEIGGSMLADSASNSPSSGSKSTKGVRFAGEEVMPQKSSQMKLNGRINGISAQLKTPACSLALRSTAWKIIHRDYGTSLSLNQLILSGPYQGSGTEAPMVIDIATFRLEYLLGPQDKDLERLLSLLTPSRDKYDSDDDILIDTLLRQRRKGAILRTRIEDVKVRLENWECMTALSALGQDLAKLSVVTEYLPEDERPGMLALVCVKAGEIQLPVNAGFGFARAAVQDVHVAHVGLPALFATSVGSLHVQQVGGPDLIRCLIPLSGVENTPVIMARMLGDEETPTVKIKVFNLCVEYSVPVLLSLMHKDESGQPAAETTDTLQSAAIARPGAADRAPVSRSSTDTSAASKKMAIDLLVHDSGIGLTPRTLASKVYFTLADARVSATMPPEDRSDLTVDIRRAAIFLTDAVDQGDPVYRATNASLNNPLRLATYFQQMGYVSIGSIMSAHLTVQEKHMIDSDGKATEVDVRVELFLLETCADSTATLFATLGDLAPPSPPSQEVKYLTQPMTIEDMMASFTGEVVEEPDARPETLFDVDEDITLHSDMLGDFPNLGDDQELFEESEMTASLYGPVSGILGSVDGDYAADVNTHDAFSETVASLLDEDPFEMAKIPEDVMTDAALLRELDKQRAPVLHDGAVTLPDAEYDDLGLEALGPAQQVLAQANRFNAPTSGRHSAAQTSAQDQVPFRLRMRDSHLIWHLHDGYDWQRTRDGIVQTVEAVEKKAEERKARRRQSHTEPEEEESVIGDFLFNSIYIGVATGHEAQDLRRAINRNIDDQVSETESVPISAMSRPTAFSAAGYSGRDPRRRRLKLGRSKSHKIAFELKGVAADVNVFAPGSGDALNAVNLRIRDFEIFDRVPTSSWRKFLTVASDGSNSRELSRPMFDIDVANVKTLAGHSASEMIIHVTALPLRLHVDQDALDFISRFFEFKDPASGDKGPPSEEPFIQRLEVDTVELCLDYKPKQVDYVGLRSGRASELKNFVTLDGANIKLKHVIVYGLRGFDKIHPTLNDIWVQDVIRTQLPTVVAGVAAMRSLANLGTGVRDVVAIPVREYRKDGRIVRGIQKGAYQFGKTTASELARLGAKVALGTQTALSSAEQYLGPANAPSSRADRDAIDQGIEDDGEEPERKATSAYANQPLGVLSGLKTARRQLEHDLLTARDALIAVQGEVMDSRGPGGAAAAVVRHAPTLLLRPVIGATRAIGTTLLGVGNQIDRSNLRKIEDKYKPR